MLNVLFIAFHFPPSGGAGVQRSLKFVKYLPSEAINPVVLAGPLKSDDHWSPNDPGLSSDLPEGTIVYRVNNIPKISSVENTSRRWLSMIKPFDKWWFNNGLKKGAEIFHNHKIDLIYVSTSPFIGANLANTLSKKFNVPWVCDLRDPWALDEMIIYPTSYHRLHEMKRMQKVLLECNLIIMNCNYAKELLLNTFFKFKRKNVIVLTNGYDSDDFINFTYDSPNKEKFRIVHTGFLHTDMGLFQRKRKHFYKLSKGILPGTDFLPRSHYYLLKAIEICSHTDSEFKDKIELVFAGNFTNVDKSIANDYSFSESIVFSGYLSHCNSINHLSNASLLFLPMHIPPQGRFSSIIPGKTYEYMASKKPILAAVPDGDAKNILKDYGNSFICNPNDYIHMSELIFEVFSLFKSNKTKCIIDDDFLLQFERKHLTTELGNLFKSII